MSWCVLEGPDDVGKTTFAHLLQSRGWEYVHADATDRLPLLAQKLALRQDNDNVVVDRCHLGEIVHGMLDRPGVIRSEGWRRLLEAFLLDRGARCFLFTERRGNPAAWENNLERHTALKYGFNEAATRSFLPWERHGFEAPEFESEDDLLWSQNRIDPEGLGADRPLYWVLGEQQNENATVPWPMATRCGTELVWPMIDPRYGRVSNALPSWWREMDDSSAFADLEQRWVALSRPRIIALGQVAFEACKAVDLHPVHVLPHPQYWLRFHARELDRYKHDLELAILQCERDAMEVIEV